MSTPTPEQIELLLERGRAWWQGKANTKPAESEYIEAIESQAATIEHLQETVALLAEHLRPGVGWDGERLHGQLNNKIIGAE